MNAADARFAEIYGLYFKHVHAYCRRRVSADRVDDASAEVFLVAWKKIDRIPDGGDALPWLYAVAYGVVTNLWRGLSRQRKLHKKLDAAGVMTVLPAEEFVIVRLQAEQILTALSRLKSSDQEVLRLSLWESLSNAEVALALGVSVELARQRLSRARKNLAEAYNHLEGKPRLATVPQKGGSR